ncbi:MAG: hypothetical protein V4539_23010 [Bacteroidota bacterium]
MSNILMFPGNYPDGKPIIFHDLINDPGKSKLLVLYSDNIALEERKYIRKMVSANPSDFVSVVFLFVQDPSIILNELKKLAVNIVDPDHVLDWKLYSSYRLLSVSSSHKIISDVRTVTELDGEYGMVREAIINAFANG